MGAMKPTITEDHREVEPYFEAPKHFGTDCVFGALEQSKIEVDLKAKKRRSRKVV